ncbi:MAG TPA: hypothetical protein DCG54_12100 [Anaerolineae bacterium]|nr:hypothetical protein [Anaerolineae bacterium]
MPAQEHGHAADSAAEITEGHVAVAEFFIFPFWVALGIMYEFKRHGSPLFLVGQQLNYTIEFIENNAGFCEKSFSSFGAIPITI